MGNEFDKEEMNAGALAAATQAHADAIEQGFDEDEAQKMATEAGEAFVEKYMIEHPEAPTAQAPESDPNAVVEAPVVVEELIKTVSELPISFEDKVNQAIGAIRYLAGQLPGGDQVFKTIFPALYK